mmetsp:Transcript_43481/g.105402  ORF Transcript_43481/g.105402 Transcript_43481/m.105402 type:complete len:754 (+) Transcript_43481:170-2431(+)
MVTAIFVVEPITEPTLRVGKKVLKNYNHRSQQEHLPERKSMRIAASTSPSSSSTSTSATATAAAGTTTTTTTTGKPSPEKTRCISTSSSTVSQDDAAETKQNQIMNQNQSPNKAQEKGTQNRNTSPTAPVRASVRARVRDVAATVAAKPAPETTSPAPIIRHNLLLGPTMMRQKRRQKQKERQAKADAMERRRLQEERRREEQEQQMVRSGLVSNMSNLQKTLARVSAMNKKKQKKQNKRVVGDSSSKNVCDENEGTNSGSNDRTHSSLAMTERDENDESSEDDVYAFDTKPRSRWVSSSTFTGQASNNELFKYSNIQSTFFTHDNDNDDHLTSGCEEQQSRSQYLLPKGFTKWLQQKVTEDKEKQRQLSLNGPEKTIQRTSSMIDVPDIDASDREKEVVKRERGRPKGNTNKKKKVSVSSTAQEGERPRINFFDPQYYSTSTGLEPVPYPGWAGGEEQIISRSPIRKQRSVSRSVNNEPTSPEERHKLAKELIAQFEADDKRKKHPIDDDDDDDDDSMNFTPFDFGDDDDGDSNINSVNDSKDGRSSDESTKDCHVTESSKRQKMDPSTAGAGINPNPLEDLSKPKVTIRSLLELAAGMASGNAMDLFYKRGIAVDSLMEAKETPATVAALQYVKRFFGGVQVAPVVFTAIDEAEAKTVLSMQSTLAFHMMSPPMQGGLGWAQADAEKAILGLLPLLGSNLGLDPIDTMSLVSFGLPVSQAISIMPFLRKMEDDVFGEAVSLHSKMVGVSNR